MKYPINKEFSPYSRMTPPIQNISKAMTAQRYQWSSSILTDLRRSLLALFTTTAEDSSLRGQGITISS